MAKKKRTTKEPLSQPQRALRRKEIAKAVERGEAPSAVAARYGVTWNHMRTSCHEFGVPWPKKGGVK